MMNTPLVSIIMPSYNAEETIIEAVESVLSQTYSNLELLIQDDASKDRTVTILKELDDPRLKVYYAPENQGYLKTCNALFTKVNGDLVTFQDADDWSDKSRIEKQVAFFIKNPNVGLCGSHVIYKTKEGKVLRERKFPTDNNTLQRDLKQYKPFCGAAMMIKREVLENIGYYNPLFDRILNEDYDWCMRIAAKYPVANIPEPLYYVRVTENSLSRSIHSPMQLISDGLSKHLNSQPSYHNELITEKKHPLVRNYLNKELAPFLEDVSLVYRKAADRSAYNELWKVSFKDSLLALKKRPFQIINWKYTITTGLRLLKNN